MICDICFRHCHLKTGQVGFCRIRRNVENRNVSLGYGRWTSLAMDPIEKKPFAHYFPGTRILSVGSFGCNLRCPFCQNHSISQAGHTQVPYQYLNVEDLVRMAIDAESLGIAFTYNEPLINYEFIVDCGRQLQKINKKCVVVTNGCVAHWVIDKLLPYVDAWNIDCKGFDASCYDKLGGDMDAVLYAIEAAAQSSHVEVTSLIVPGMNDDRMLFEKEVDWLAGLDHTIPLHITRYFPCYQYDEPATSIELLHEFYTVAAKKLKYVHLGNC